MFAALILVGLLIAGYLYTAMVSPYHPLSRVKPFFTTRREKNGQITLTYARPIRFLSLPMTSLIHALQAVMRIFTNAWVSEPPLKGSLKEIIEQIHIIRFDPDKPYVISAGHFAELYARNFGIFYAAMMDSRIETAPDDWEKRQRVTLQTVAVDLELMKQAKKAFTTFFPVTPGIFSGVKIYTEQSDSIFAVVYTLNALSDPAFIPSRFPSDAKPLYPHQTIKSARSLIRQYRSSMEQIIHDYLAAVLDPKTGLIRTDISLSSARDGIRRKSSFYDNVIAWSTVQLAKRLGYRIQAEEYSAWKKRIIDAFWDEERGIFIDDLSGELTEDVLFSGDSFVVVSAGFLSPKIKSEKAMLARMVAYVEKHKLDSPFPLFYAQRDQLDRLYLPVRLFTTSYMGRSIWSHWGIEYIKTLLLLGPKNSVCGRKARQHLKRYAENIVRYGGYPELYADNGDIFHTPFYKSLLYTGWVINFEQASMLAEAQ